MTDQPPSLPATAADAQGRGEAATDTCHARCAEFRAWFTTETRGRLDPDEAHEVLDMVLNRLTDQGRLR